MELETFLDLCKQYSDLGWAVQKQLHSAVNGDEPLDELNNNALSEICHFLEQAGGDGVEGAEDEAERIKKHLGEQA